MEVIYHSVEEVVGKTLIKTSAMPMYYIDNKGVKVPAKVIVEKVDVLKPASELTAEEIEEKVLKDSITSTIQPRLSGDITLDGSYPDVIIKGKNDAIKQAENAAGVDYPMEFVWLDGASTATGVVTFLDENIKKVYVVKGTYEAPIIQFINEQKLGGKALARPYYVRAAGKIEVYMDGFSGAGTSGDPYQITNWAQLQSMNTYKTAYFILMNNLSSSTSDYSTYAASTSNSNLGWLPVGDGTTAFTGSFDGRGFTVSDLNIIRTTDRVGLFGALGSGALIKNVGLLNVHIHGGGSGGYVGSLAGVAGASIIFNCYSTGTVTRNDGNYIGGLIGIGGTGTVRNCYSEVNVVGSGGDYKGGFVGAQQGNITNCYSKGSVEKTAAGYGGFSGVYYSGTTTSCYWDATTSDNSTSASGTSKTTAQMKTMSTFSGWLISGSVDNYNSWLISDGNDYPKLTFRGMTEDVAKLITTWAELAGVKDYLSGYYKLMNHLNADSVGYSTYAASTSNTNTGWLPLGNYSLDSSFFSGYFNGQGYAISDLNINRASTTYQGLFGNNSGTISNLKVLNVTISGSRFAGGLAGLSGGGSITNCGSSGSVTSSDYAVGGLIGGCTSPVNRCWSSCSVVSTYTGDTSEAGGLIGEMNSYTLTDCYATGSVHDSSVYGYAGGLVGILYNGYINRCYSTGAVTSDNAAQIGGLVGYHGGGGTQTYIHWDATTSGVATTNMYTSNETTGSQTTAQMKTEATFSSWSIDAKSTWTTETWYIDATVDYPRLAWQREFPVLDDFNRANESPLANNWSSIPAISGGATLVSNTMHSPGYYYGSYWNLGIPNADCEVGFKLITIGNPGPNIALRLDTASLNGYLLYVSATEWFFIRIDGGTSTYFASQSRTTANGTYVKFRMVGSTMYAIFNGVVDAHTDTDATYSAAGKSGILFQTSSDVVDNFTIQNYVAPPVTSNFKSYNTNLRANIKSINTNLIANSKSLNTNT